MKNTMEPSIIIQWYLQLLPHASFISLLISIKETHFDNMSRISRKEQQRKSVSRRVKCSNNIIRGLVGRSSLSSSVFSLSRARVLSVSGAHGGG